MGSSLRPSTYQSQPQQRGRERNGVLLLSLIIGFGAIAMALQLRVRPSTSDDTEARVAPGAVNTEDSPPHELAGALSGSSPGLLPSDDVVELPADEVRYLQELERLARADKARALQWVDLGDRRYPARGMRAEARQALRVTLLVELGLMTEARERARRFIEEHPTSPYRRLVQGQTGIHPRPGPPPGIE
jgi:hypothetical protein